MASKKENKQNNFSSKRLVFLKKSKKRADSITPIVLFTIALFFLVLTVGRITVLGQMINDIIFTLLFG